MISVLSDILCGTSKVLPMYSEMSSRCCEQISRAGLHLSKRCYNAMKQGFILLICTSLVHVVGAAESCEFADQTWPPAARSATDVCRYNTPETILPHQVPDHFQNHNLTEVWALVSGGPACLASMQLAPLLEAAATTFVEQHFVTIDVRSALMWSNEFQMLLEVPSIIRLRQVDLQNQTPLQAIARRSRRLSRCLLTRWADTDSLCSQMTNCILSRQTSHIFLHGSNFCSLVKPTPADPQPTYWFSSHELAALIATAIAHRLLSTFWRR